MKILLLHKYGPKAASFRYRFQQYLPHLEAQGIECTVSSFLDDDYLIHRFDTGRIRVGPVLRAFGRRLSDLVRAHHYDLVIIYCELLPYFPAIFERYLNLRKIPYIVDLDDAIFHTYDQSAFPPVRWLLSTKIRKVIAGASCVFAGSRYLADYAKRQNSNVVILPTVIDLEKYGRTKTTVRSVRRPFTIGWIGSPSTSLYLESIGSVLQKFCKEHDARVVLVGSGDIDLPKVPVEYREWSDATEIKDLLEFDVGIMPLSDSPWSRGKCGFKLIQYMACGLPVIASPVGVNVDIVVHGKNGYLAGSEQEWLDALSQLYHNPELRLAMGAEGRKRIEGRYSLQVTSATVVEKVREVSTPKTGVAERHNWSGATNIDLATVDGFGDEWSRFDQSKLSEAELVELFRRYFRIFPWERLTPGSQGFDLGCGTGRWAKLVAGRVGKLHCIDPSDPALSVAKRTLRDFDNCEFHLASVDQMPLPDNSMDFGYTLGTLHHVPDTEAGIAACVAKLKPEAPFLVYLYYDLSDRPGWFQTLWRVTDYFRRGISRLPHPIRYGISQMIAATIYFPLARTSLVLEKCGLGVSNFPLSFYRNLSFYTMRTDTLDRFGTRLEHRFSADRIKKMMENAGLERVEFSDFVPKWCAIGYKKAASH